MNIGIAQINTTVGDLTGNATLIRNAYRKLVAQGADLVITPELALSGYPPRDLLFQGDFVTENLNHLDALEQSLGEVPLLVGFVDINTQKGKPFYNAAALLLKGAPRIIAHKRLLPTYDVFEEDRYFEAGSASTSFLYQGVRWGITICEDLWTYPFLARELYRVNPAEELLAQGAEILLNLSASPFEMGKGAQRLAMLEAQAQRWHLPIVYCNSIGGNDQLIFDGASMVLDAHGALVGSCTSFHEELAVMGLPLSQGMRHDQYPPYTILRPARVEDPMHALHDALVLGLHDYVNKCGFKHALLGLSGGIDSALVAALAVAALGRENVTGVLMPGPYSSEGSITDALALAKNLGIPTRTLPMSPLYQEAQHTLHTSLSGHAATTTQENLQARLRGIILMALSNEYGSLVLTTGNKSELAMGYCTLYGDMCGGLAVLADVLKTHCYQLAHWINRTQEIIPWPSLHKPPSAELRPNQKDQDSLPPYDTLDAILSLLIEEEYSFTEILDRGFPEETVRFIVRTLSQNEYKRQQSAPVLKVTRHAFGLGRHFPIAQKYREG